MGKKSNTKKIKCLQDVHKWIEELTKEIATAGSELPRLFYRGHSDSSYKLQASVYRTDTDGRSFQPYEYAIYQEMLNCSPNAFLNDNSIFERLVRMQHHELPTRLFDVTENPLVALFFACATDSDIDGQLLLFPIYKEHGLFQADLDGVIFAGLEAPVDFLSLAKEAIRDIQKSVDDFFKSYVLPDVSVQYKNDLSNLISLFEPVAVLDQCFNIKEIIEKLDTLEGCLQLFIKEQKDRYKINMAQVALTPETHTHVNVLSLERTLNHLVEKFVKNKCALMKILNQYNCRKLDDYFRQFAEFKFVYPPMNNERIRRQQGAFFIHPPLLEAKNAQNIMDIKHYPILIDARYKDQLLRQLEKTGITRGYIFPELEELANDIKNRYRGKPLT